MDNSRVSSQNLIQLFLGLPRLTEAKGQYDAQVKNVRRSKKKKIGIRFIVNNDAKTPDKVENILKEYVDIAVESGIEGIQYEAKTKQVIVDDVFAIAAVMNAYLEKNPEKINSEIIDGVGEQISTLVGEIFSANSAETKNEADNSYESAAKLELSRQFLALMEQIPSKVCDIKNCKIESQINRNGSVEIGFQVGEGNTEKSLGYMKDFVTCLDSSCAQAPQRFGYDVDLQRYLFASSQELYDFMCAYFDAALPDNVYSNHTLRDFRIINTIALSETLESIIDDYVPNMHLNNGGQNFSKPRSVAAAVTGLREMLNTVPDSENVYINVSEDERTEVYTFTIGCSEFSSKKQSLEKFEVMTEFFDIATLYGDRSDISVLWHESGDNIDIQVRDIRQLLPMFDWFYRDHNLAGPEDVDVSFRDKYGALDRSKRDKHIQDTVKAFDEAAEMKDVFARLPMRQYVDMDHAKVCYIMQSKAPAAASIDEIEATILQEYEGGEAFSKLLKMHKSYIVH